MFLLCQCFQRAGWSNTNVSLSNRALKAWVNWWLSFASWGELTDEEIPLSTKLCQPGEWNHFPALFCLFVCFGSYSLLFSLHCIAVFFKLDSWTLLELFLFMNRLWVCLCMRDEGWNLLLHQFAYVTQNIWFHSLINI
jgi:hypothetical protein